MAMTEKMNHACMRPSATDALEALARSPGTSHAESGVEVEAPGPVCATAMTTEGTHLKMIWASKLSAGGNAPVSVCVSAPSMGKVYPVKRTAVAVLHGVIA